MVTRHALDFRSWLYAGGYLSRKMVFLDLRFWWDLVDEEGEEARELNRLLRDLVARKVILCPVSVSLFMEVMKHPEAAKRSACFALMDELSEGVAARIGHYRFIDEFMCVVRDQSIPRDVGYTHFIDAYTPRGYHLEFPAEGWTAANAERMTTRLQDYLSSMTITSFMGLRRQRFPAKHLIELREGWTKLASEVTAWRTDHPMMTAREIEQAEFGGQVRSLALQLYQALLQLEPAEQLRVLRASESETRALLERCPYFWCHYKLTAAGRSHRETTSENDMWDLQHIADVLPYADCLACDRAMRHLCTEILHLDSRYDVAIVGRTSGLLEWLQLA
jgi:hypothetical protein